MAANTLRKPAHEKETGIIEYQANGEIVKLSPGIVKNYLVTGGGNVTNEEIGFFLSLCKYQHLNPFTRDAYLIKYGDRPATMVVGKDTFLKRARREQDFLGIQAGIIVADRETAETQYREGTFYQKKIEDLVGGWAKVFVHGFSHPVFASVPLDEYVGRKGNGEVNGQWASKPGTMIRKVAIVQALREAFPDNSGGMYVQEERPEVADVILPEAAVVVEDVKPAEVTVEPVMDEPKKEEPNAAMAALFGGR